MSWFKLPGIAVAVPLLMGTMVAGLGPPRPLLAVGLVGLGAALGRAGGRAVAVAAAALALAWARPAGRVEPPVWVEAERPVEVGGRLAEPWRRSRFGWRGEVEVRTVRQGSRAGVWRTRLSVDLGGVQPGPAGGPLALKGVLRRAPPLANDPPLPAGRWRLRVKSARLIAGGAASGSFAPRRLSFRRRVEALFDDRPGGAGLELARALILGDTDRLDRAVLGGLRRVGLGHLLAVSGLHVGMVGWLLWLAGWPLPRVLRHALPLVGAAAYLALVGPRPAILRATVMVTLATTSLARRRRPQSINALCWGLAVIVLLDVDAVGDLGFVLTAAATTGIVVLAPALERRWRGPPRVIGRALAASIGAQLATLPWTLSRFHTLSLAAVPLNLFAVPWTALTLAASLLWLAAALAGWCVAAPGLAVLDALATPYGWLAELGPRAAGLVPSGAGFGAASAVAMGLTAAFLGRRLRWRVASLAVAIGVLWWPPPRDGVELVMLDVGQGESILLRDGARAVLVDGGGWHRRDIAREVLVPALARLGVRRLDAVVVTHPDLDHCRGLAEIATYLPVAELWTATGLARDGCVGSLRRRPGIRWRPLWRGRRARFGRWRLETLYPQPGTRGGGNDRSLVLRAESGGRRVLLTGDLDGAGERRLLALAASGELSAQVLKVAHHGSASSSGAALLRRVSPGLALISAGRSNGYGHPAPVVLDRLERGGVRVLRTDRTGMIRLAWPVSPGQ